MPGLCRPEDLGVRKYSPELQGQRKTNINQPPQPRMTKACEHQLCGGNQEDFLKEVAFELGLKDGGRGGGQHSRPQESLVCRVWLEEPEEEE